LLFREVDFIHRMIISETNENLRNCLAKPACNYMDGSSFGDLPLGALLTIGWGVAFGSPNDR
jgi:hypothetical protein